MFIKMYIENVFLTFCSAELNLLYRQGLVLYIQNIRLWSTHSAHMFLIHERTPTKRINICPIRWCY